MFCTIDVVFAISAIGFINLLYFHKPVILKGPLIVSVKLLLSNFAQHYGKTPVTQTLKGNEKQLELAGNSCYHGKFSKNADQGKGNLVQVRGEFELSSFYCIYSVNGVGRPKRLLPHAKMLLVLIHFSSGK